MSIGDQMLKTIEAIHAAGLEDNLWPDALSQVMQTVGGIAATLEVFDRKATKLIEFRSYGLPPKNETAYLEHYAALNPRIPALINGTPGGLITDYMVLDERSMNRDAFYAGLLAPVGYRYFIGGTIDVFERESSLFSVQRAKKQGHVGGREADAMLTLLPHVRQALQTKRLLRDSQATIRSLEETLDWLSHGVARVRHDGYVYYCNEPLQAMAQRNDGLRIARGRLEFDTGDARDKFSNAIAAIGQIRRGAALAGNTDFVVRRPSGLPPYFVLLRPLSSERRHRDGIGADAVVFVHDPMQRHQSSIALLRETFGFTTAEASLAQAIQSGATITTYAQQSRLSLNTIYTHLRRIKEKTGCHRMPELIQKLNELQTPLRRADR